MKENGECKNDPSHILYFSFVNLMEKGLSKVAFTKPNSRDCCIKNEIPANSIVWKNTYFNRADK